MALYDVIVIGGGPGGLSCALVLGRCNRRVLLVDEGKPRNAASRAVHGFLTRDGTAPTALRRLGRRELVRYDVTLVDGRADAERERDGFTVRVGRRRFRSRFLVLATGMIDDIPDIPGARALYGRGVYHCPYCDAWELRGGRFAAYGGEAAEVAIMLRAWSDDVLYCADGHRVPRSNARKLEEAGVHILEPKIVKLTGRREGLRGIGLEDGTEVPCDAFFFKIGRGQRSELCGRLGCTFTKKGAVRTKGLQGTGIPGLFVVGDAGDDLQLAIIAAADGAKAAIAINRSLHGP